MFYSIVIIVYELESQLVSYYTVCMCIKTSIIQYKVRILNSFFFFNEVFIICVTFIAVPSFGFLDNTPQVTGNSVRLLLDIGRCGPVTCTFLRANRVTRVVNCEYLI